MTSTTKEKSDLVEAALERFRNEIETVASPYYLWKAIRNKISSDENILDAYNSTPTFWITTLHSLQVSQFVGIGRIFDTNRSSFSLDRLKKICITNIDAFSHEGLIHRKGWVDLDEDEFDEEVLGQISEGLWMGEGPGWKRRYVDRSYEISKADIETIFASLNDAISIYKRGAKKARDNIFAHSNFRAGERPSDSFEGVIIGEFERVLDDIHTVLFILKENFSNGRIPARVPYLYVPYDEIEKSVDRVTAKLLQKLP